MHRVCVTMRRTCVGRQWVRVGTGHVHIRPLTPHLHITHEQHTFIPMTSTDVPEACMFGSASSVIHASGLLRMLVEYYTVFACMLRRLRYVSDSSVIVNETCMVHAWFVSDFCPWHPKNLVNFSMNKHAQTQFVRDLWVICAWSGVWLAL